jgi:hypothetical protein
MLRSARTETFAFNSTILARDRCAVAKRARLGPGDLRMDAAARGAVGGAKRGFRVSLEAETDS